MSPLFLWDVGPYLGTNPFQGARPFLKKRDLFPGPLPTSPGSFALPHWEPCGARIRHSGFWDLNQTPFRSARGNGGHRPSLPNGVRPSLKTDWPMFNSCSHGTLLIFGLQSSCLNICYYHQDLHPRRLHPRPRIPRHTLLLQTCWWCAPLIFQDGLGGWPTSPRTSSTLYEGLIPALMARRGRRRTENSPPRSTHVPGDAKCVRSVDDQCVLQFTLVLAASCVLHRRRSRVIWRYVSIPNALPGDDLSEVSCGAAPGLRHTRPHRAFGCHDPRTSLNHPIGSSDERCVQRART